MLSQFFQKAATMSSLLPPSRPQPQRTVTRHSLKISDSSDPFTPQRAEFIWLKLICATRDVGDESNMASMNEKQWQIALNQYRITIEPGLATKVFQMVLARKGKKLFRTDFVGFVERELNDGDEFHARAQMPTDEFGTLEESSEEMIAVVASKVVDALLEGQPLDVFELMKGAFCIDENASVEELLQMMDVVEWHHRMEIMEHIAHDPNVSFTQLNASFIIQKWSLQFQDERSQLVRIALETCPILIERMLTERIRVDPSVLLDGLMFPIKAKRSKELQRLGQTCGERLMTVFLRHFASGGDMDDCSVSSSSPTASYDGFDPLATVVQTLCVKILESGKHEAVRKGFLSYIVQLIAFHKLSYEAIRIFDHDEATAEMAAMLNLTLSDKKPEVREESFRLMRLLDKMIEVTPFPEVKNGIEAHVLAQVDPSARMRFERKKNRAKRSRSRPALRARLMRAKSTGDQPEDDSPPLPQFGHGRSNSVPVAHLSAPRELD